MEKLMETGGNTLENWLCTYFTKNVLDDIQ